MRDQQTVNSMLCPVCRTGLSLSDRSGIEIDYCPSCRGVWLDRGELDKIIDRTDSGSAPPARDQRENRSDTGGIKGKLWAAASAMMDEDRRDHRTADRYQRDDTNHRRKKRPSLSDFFD